MFGMCQGRDRALSSPASGSGLSRRIVRVIIPSGCWVCNSNSEQQHLLLKIGTFPAGASGTIVRDRGAGIGTPPVIHYLLPGSFPAASPPARRNPVPGSAGDDNPNNCSLPNRARQLALIKKIILGVDTLYNMGYYGIIV